MCLACQTLLAITLAGASISLGGCDRQDSYIHRASELTPEDRREIQIVKASPLGKPALMREVVDGMVADDATLGDCEYWVSKMVQYDQVKDRYGLYPWHYRVKCFVDAGEDELEYVWELDNSEWGITSFRWGFAPNLDD